MVVASVDFTQFLAKDSGIPFDVKFEVFENDEAVEKLGTVSAHKFVLSSVSPVFRRQFFGSMKMDSSSIVKLYKVDPRVLETFIKVIYGDKEISKDITVMFEVLDLADFYIIDPVKMKMIDSIKDQINFDNVKSIAEAAATFVHNKELTQSMLNNCGAFLQNNLKRYGEIQEFLVAEDVEDHIVDDIIATRCNNCEHFKCKNGLYAVFPEHELLRVGSKVEKWVRSGSTTEGFTTEIYTCTVAEVKTGGPVWPSVPRMSPVERGSVSLSLIHI